MSSRSRTDLHSSFTSSQLTFDSRPTSLLSQIISSQKVPPFCKTSSACLVSHLNYPATLPTGGAAPLVRKLSENKYECRHNVSTDRRLCPNLYLVSNIEHKGALTRNVSVGRNNLLNTVRRKFPRLKLLMFLL